MRRIMMVFLVFTAVVVVGQAGDDSVFHVMIVNDDGVDAPGIAALAAVFAADPSYRVTVVAPTDHQSGKGSALTIFGEIPLRPHAPLAGAPTWSVDATPATTTRIGLSFTLADDPPDLVVSGINKGENVGRIAWYSGTVGAAREAVLAGSTAVAFSLKLNWADPKPDFEDAALWAKPVVDFIRKNPLPEGTYLNVNIPSEPASIRGYRVCRMGLEAPQVAGFEVQREEDGVRFLKSLWAPALSTTAGSDTAALHQGWVTVVPLGLDSTAYHVLPELWVLWQDEALQKVQGTRVE
ncbi:MAG: 5'/3'-nucleotidase SurE [Thermoanaerobaculales bacterium]|nr:5'/3'-nucleotidase SurE [Thermoanaerobaculales bacterium]